MHLIITECNANEIPGQIDVIPHNTENYICVRKRVDGTGIRFSFIDSYKFLACSIEKLALYLPNNQKTILRKYFPKDEEFNMLTQKSVFPYDFVDGLGALNEPRLPSKEFFYNTLTESHISDDDYNRAISTFDFFKCQSVGQYSDLYLMKDVLLLSDIFESFRSRMINSHGLDPLHYITLPSFSFDAMLRFTNVNLQLLTDIEMVIFFQNAIRGGLIYCSKRYAESNNHYMGSNFETGDLPILLRCK